MNLKILVVLCLVYSVAANVNNESTTNTSATSTPAIVNSEEATSTPALTGKMLASLADKYREDSISKIINSISTFCREYLTTYREYIITQASNGKRIVGADFPYEYIPDMCLLQDVKQYIELSVGDNLNLNVWLRMTSNGCKFNGIMFSW